MNDHNLASDCRGDSLASASIAAFKVTASKGRVRHTELLGVSTTWNPNPTR